MSTLTLVMQIWVKFKESNQRLLGTTGLESNMIWTRLAPELELLNKMPNSGIRESQIWSEEEFKDISFLPEQI